MLCKLTASVEDNIKADNAVGSDLLLVTEPVERQKYLAEKSSPMLQTMMQRISYVRFLAQWRNLQLQQLSQLLGHPLQESLLLSHEELVAPKRTTPVCSYCKETSHRNQVRNKIDLCPKRKKDDGDT